MSQRLALLAFDRFRADFDAIGVTLEDLLRAGVAKRKRKRIARNRSAA